MHIRKILTLGVLVVGLVCPLTTAWATGNEMMLTFTGYTNRTGALTDFPVLVVFSNGVGQSSFDFTQHPFASPNGYDLRFFDSANNPLDYEIESWDTSSACYVWVKVPNLPNDGTGSIKAKWGDVSQSSQLPCTTNGATWTSYNGVWHLDEAAVDGQTSMVHRDSTANGVNGLQNMNAGQAGVIGGGQYFDGSTDWIDIANQSALNMGSTFSVSAWMRFDGALVEWNRLISRKPYWWGNSGWELQLSYGSDTQLDARGSGWAGASVPSMVTSWLSHDWYYVTVVYNDATATFYRDGALQGSGTVDAVVDNDSPLVLGNNAGYSEAKWNGMFDEVRIQDGTPSGDWIWATYQNQAQNDGFCTYGDVSLSGDMNVGNGNGATDVKDTSATLNGMLQASAPAEVSVFWGPTDGSVDASAWSNRCDFGVSLVGVTLSTNLFGLTPNTQYYYRYRGIDSENAEVWAPASATFTTPDVPAITNLGTTLVRFDKATIGGNLTHGYRASVTANWGTTPENLTFSLNLGNRAEGSFTVTLNGLDKNTVYYYALHATNAYGDVWSDVRSFKSGNFVDETYTDATLGSMKYRVCFPQNYEPSGDTVPLILYLHSAAERGDSVEDVFANNGWTNTWVNLLVDETQTGGHQAVLVIPQSGAWQVWNSANAGDNWSVGNYTNASQPAISSRLQLAVDILDQVRETYNVDNNRVYITGPSMGGYGTWDALARFPEKFAAAMPISGGGNKEAARTVFKGKPVWAYHGAVDGLILPANTDQLTDAMRAMGGRPLYSRPADQGHSGFDLFYTPGYFTVDSPSVTGGTGMNVYDWLFSQTSATGGTYIDPTAAIVVGMGDWAQNLSGKLADESATIWYNVIGVSSNSITLFDTNGAETALSISYVSGSLGVWAGATPSEYSDAIKSTFSSGSLENAIGTTNNYSTPLVWTLNGLNDRSRYTIEIVSCFGAPWAALSGFEVTGRETFSGTISAPYNYTNLLVFADVRSQNGTITLKNWKVDGYYSILTAFRLLRTAPLPAETVLLIR